MRWFWPFLILASGLALALPSGPHLASATESASESAAAGRLGLQALSPPIEAPDFALENIDGDVARLSDFRGRWVLLTFWATWCGPCRSEMPSLQRLWERQGTDGLAVIAIAVGSDPGNAADFVRRNGLTFPVLLDQGDRVGSAYRASSIPLTYLVDPGGMLVGITRGARDWERVAGAVASLLDGAETGDAAAAPDPPPAAEPPAPITLPATLVPPTGTASLGPGPFRAGEPFELRIEVSWSGDADEYALLPPRVELPDGVVQHTLAAATTSLDGTQRVSYAVHLEAAAAGSYALDPIELRFQLPGREELLYTRVAGPTVAVEQPRSWGIWAIAGLGVAVVLGGGVALSRRRR